METKICSSCGKELPINDYYQFLDKRIGRIVSYGKCKKCERERRQYLTKSGYKPEPKVKKPRGLDSRELDRLSKEAWESGMSYGQYVAKLYREKERKAKQRGEQ